MSDIKKPSRRRRFVIIGGLLAAASLVAIPVAMAGDDRGGGCHRGKLTAERMQDRADWFLDKAMSKLDGTEQQRASLDAVVDSLIPQVLTWRDEGKALKAELRDLLLADTIDRRALEDVRKRALVMADRVSAEAMDALADAAEVLTPEQRAQVAEHIARRHKRR